MKCCLYVLTCLFIFSCQQQLERDNQRLLAEVDSLKAQVQQLKVENNQLRVELGGRPQIGFEVQIGAFEFFDVKAHQESMVKLREVKEDGMSKYVLGTFIRFEEAEHFLQDLHRMGLTDAFIAGIVGGERTTVERAREAAKLAYGY